MQTIPSRKNEWLDIAVLLLLAFIAAFITERFNTKTLISMFLFFVVPAIYLLLKRGHLNSLKIFVTTIVIGITGGAVDAAITANKGWWIPETQLVFHQRFFGIWNIDNTLCYMGGMLYIVVFYEYFLDVQRHRKLSRRFHYFAWLPIITSVTLVVFATIFPNLLSNIRYAYLTLALPFVVVPIILLFVLGRRNILELLGKFSLVSIFFFIVTLTNEITALRGGQWIFPGEYIGTVHLAGVIIPIEEFMMYIMMFAFTGLAYYEIFVDDLS